MNWSQEPGYFMSIEELMALFWMLGLVPVQFEKLEALFFYTFSSELEYVTMRCG